MLLTFENAAHTGHNMSRVDDYVRNICASLNIEVDEIVITFGALESNLSGVNKHTTSGMAGCVERLGDRAFHILIDSTFRTGQQVVALAHELIHVAQFASGRLTALRQGEGFIWDGQHYPSDTPYKSRPWEVEAHAKECEVAAAA